MTDILILRKEAVENATKAVEFDDKDNFEEACKFYIKAAEKLTYLSKVDENQYNKETYRKKAMEYCERARKLKESLTAKTEPQAITAE
jgi:hypothetical protein